MERLDGSMNRRTNMSATSADGNKERVRAVRPSGWEGGPRAWSDNDIMCQVNRLAESLNGEPRFIGQIAEFNGATLVLSATDTGRELIIVLDGHGASVRPRAGEPFDVKIEATEEVLWAVLSGQMDADGAFFAGRVRIRGSIVTAFRIKNRFLSLLQAHLARESEVAGRFAADR